MSVVGVMNNGGPEGSGYVPHGITNLLLIDSPKICGGDRWFTVKDKLVEKRSTAVVMSRTSSSSSDESSIGDNSDVTGGAIKEDSGETEEEVQSPFKGPLDAMDALEDVLPMRKGISRFYNGKSKSFASLGEASSMSSIKHMTKPDNPYNKRRRNLLASALIWDKNNHHHHRSSPLSGVNGGGISKKKSCNSSNHATTLAFALSMNNNNYDDDDDIGCGVINNIGLSRFYSSSSRGFNNLSGCRSFSFADLQQPGSKMDATANPNPN